MPFRKIVVAAAFLICLVRPSVAAAIPMPLEPIEVERSAQISAGVPHISPDGSQLVSFLTKASSGLNSVLVERINGGPFSGEMTLSTNSNAELPSLAFNPDGSIYAIWGIATANSPAEQSIRPAGGSFSSPAFVPNCGRFVDSAIGPDGSLAVTCSHAEGTLPPNSYWLGTSPAFGPVSVTEQLNPAAYDPFIQPSVAWGKDGTLAVVASYWTTTTNPPPANETKRIRVTVRNPARGIFATIDLANVTQPNEIEVNGEPVVLDDGTVAFSTGGTAGARTYLSTPAGTSFIPQTLTGEAATEPAVDAAQNIHVMSAAQGPPRGYWATLRPPGGTFGTPVPIPLAGAGDPYIGFEGFTVAPDGTEYAVIRAEDGIYATSRGPGQAAFETPRQLGAGSPANNPEVAVTAESDLLVSWPIEVAPNDFKLFVGGLDKTPPKVLLSGFPIKADPGVPTTFSASATDSMGMRSTGWNFGEGEVAGGDQTHTFSKDGRYDVTYTATDRAGNQTVEKRQVVVGDPPPAVSLRIKAPKKLKFRVLKRKGVKLTVNATPAMKLNLRVAASKRALKRKPLAKKAVKGLRTKLTVKLKPDKRRLGRSKKFNLIIQVTGTTASGQKVTRTSKVKIRP